MREIFVRGAVLGLLAASVGCSGESTSPDNLILPNAGGLVVSNTPASMAKETDSLQLLSVTTSCEGDRPVVEIENRLVGGKSGSELDALILEKGPTNERVLAVLGIAGIRDDRGIDDHIVLSYKGEVFTPDANYTDVPVSPFPKKGGERYQLERRQVSSMEWNGNRRVLRFREYTKVKAKVTFQVPYCSGTFFSSG